MLSIPSRKSIWIDCIVLLAGSPCYAQKWSLAFQRVRHVFDLAPDLTPTGGGAFTSHGHQEVGLMRITALCRTIAFGCVVGSMLALPVTSSAQTAQDYRLPPTSRRPVVG